MHATSDPVDTSASTGGTQGSSTEFPPLAMPTLLAVLQQWMLSKPQSTDVSEVEGSALTHQLAWLVLATLCTPSAATPSQSIVEAPPQQEQLDDGLTNNTLVHNNALLAEELAALHADYDSALTCIRELQNEIAIWKDRDAQWVKRDTTWQARDASWAKREARWNTRDAYWQRMLKEAREREANHLAELRRQRALIDRMTLRMRRLQAFHQQHIQQQGMIEGMHEFLDPSMTGGAGDDDGAASAPARRMVLPAWNAGFDLKGFVQPLPPGMTINNTPTASLSNAMRTRRMVVRGVRASAMTCRML